MDKFICVQNPDPLCSWSLAMLEGAKEAGHMTSIQGVLLFNVSKYELWF